MTYPQRYRRSIRLAGYDYSRSGAYFVSICTRNRECLFGVLVDAGMQLNGPGSIVQTAWDDLPSHYPHLELDAFVIMPNHIHGIVVLADFESRRGGFETRPYDTGAYNADRALEKACLARDRPRVQDLFRTPYQCPAK